MTEGGRSGVIGQAVAGAAAELAADRRAADGEQLGLLPLPIGNPRAKHLRRDVERKNQAGRPPGAVNKSTAELRAWLLARGIHPLHQMFRWMQHTPQSLAAELGCTQLEAFDRLRLLWSDAAPYFAARFAPVDGQGNAVAPTFLMQIGGGRAPGAADLPPWMDAPQTIENTAVSEPAPLVSHANVSHGEDK